MLPFVSDVEVGEFVLIRDSPTASVVYLARVDAVDDLTIDVSAWGSHYKNQTKKEFKPVMILDENESPTTRPSSGAACSPWTWQLPADALSDLVIARDIGILPSGKLDTAARKILRTHPTPLKMRQFKS